MKFYLAPMEGITVFIYRNAYEKFFGNIDKYYTPFVVPNRSKSLKTREFRDILPENNKNLNVIPQILTNHSKGFIFTARKLQSLGYNEINLNLGCPSGTVVSKGKGSGFLGKKDELDAFLDEIYTIDDMKISIKTRLGIENPEEFYDILDIYNKYPLEELIIHPRTRKDFYGNVPNLELFKYAMEKSNVSLCYNGDIFTKEDYYRIHEQFPNIDKFMIGRGILSNPSLINEINGGPELNKKILKDFHDEIFNSYKEVFKEDKNAMYRMKELWGFMMYVFTDHKKYIKKIKKSQKVEDYNHAVESLFAEQELIKGAGLFHSEY